MLLKNLDSKNSYLRNFLRFLKRIDISFFKYELKISFFRTNFFNLGKLKDNYKKLKVY